MPLSKNPLIDLVVFGRLVRAARIIAGFESVKAAADAVRERTGITISDRTLYAIERGEQEPTITQLVAFAMAFNPPGGQVFFAQAYRDDVRVMLRAARGTGGAVADGPS